MKTQPAGSEVPPGKPITVGLTCWRWEHPAPQVIKLSQQVGVSLLLTENLHGLYRDVQCQVWGRNVDRFISEFVRHC